jgi:PAS domain-containing protein
VLPADSVFDDYEVSHTFETIGPKVMLVNGRRLDHVQLILLGIRDITGAKRAEDALRAGEERLRRMMNVEGAGVLTFDEASGTLLSANEAFLHMSGYAAADVAAGRLSWQALTPPEHVEASLSSCGGWPRPGGSGRTRRSTCGGTGPGRGCCSLGRASAAARSSSTASTSTTASGPRPTCGRTRSGCG